MTANKNNLLSSKCYKHFVGLLSKTVEILVIFISIVSHFVHREETPEESQRNYYGNIFPNDYRSVVDPWNTPQRRITPLEEDQDSEN